jgi:hypothetical protein
MQLEPVQTSPIGRRSRLRTITAIVAPVVALVLVVAIAWPGGSIEPVPADPLTPEDPPAFVPSPSAPHPSPGLAIAEGEFPERAFGLRVRGVDELVAARRAGRLDDAVVAVGGYLVPDLRPLDCDPVGPDGIDPFCRRSILLVSRPDPPAADRGAAGSQVPSWLSRPHLHPQVPPGTLLPRLDQLTIAGADDALTPIRVVLIGRFDDPRAVSCQPGGRHCGEELVVERLAWAEGRWRERVVVRDPGLPGSQAAGNPLALRVIASREADRGEVILGQAIVRLERLRTIDPDAAAAAEAAAGPVEGALWYLRTMRSWPETGIVVGWAVVDDRTGFIFAVSRDPRIDRNQVPSPPP